jgi:hypothetical protein
MQTYICIDYEKQNENHESSVIIAVALILYINDVKHSYFAQLF